MINFRYHIVSLMAVFLALSVGIVIGVTLRPSVDSGLNQQAQQDRQTVQDLRAEIEHRNTLDSYQQAWSARVGAQVTSGLLTGERVALIVMPGAPGAVVSAIAKAVPESGGVVTKTVRVDDSAFTDTGAAAIDDAVSPYAELLGLGEDAAAPTRLGVAVGRAVLAKDAATQDTMARSITRSLSSAGVIAVDGRATDQAQLAIVVSSAATTPPTTSDLLTAHVQFDLALHQMAAGLVVAGPNSDEIEGTDVLAVRSDSSSVDVLSTVDVADLTSGVVTTLLAGKEQLVGRQGHYGALTGADAPTPELPVR